MARAPHAAPCDAAFSLASIARTPDPSGRGCDYTSKPAEVRKISVLSKGTRPKREAVVMDGVSSVPRGAAISVGESNMSGLKFARCAAMTFACLLVLGASRLRLAKQV